MKKLLVLIAIVAAVCADSSAFMVDWNRADSISIDNIDYKIFKDSKVAYVRKVNADSVTIPSKIEYGNDSYDVIGINHLYETYNNGFRTVVVPTSIKYVQENALIYYNLNDIYLNYLKEIGVDCIDTQNAREWMSATLYPFQRFNQSVPLDSPSRSSAYDDSDTYYIYPWDPIWVYDILETTYILNEDGEPVPSDMTGENRFGGPKYQGFTNCQYVRNFMNIEFDESVKGIPSKAFRRCRKLKTIKLPTSLDSIGYQAFSECDAIQEVAWPQTIKRIGSRAFEYCRLLSFTEIPSEITEIGDSAFYYMEGLKNVTLPRGLQRLGVATFAMCNNLESFVLPEQMDSIPALTFYDCANLKKINFPAKLKSIKSRAFSGCSALEEIALPDSLKYIGFGAFSDCEKLKKINIPNSVEFLGNAAFSGCSNVEELKLPNSIKVIPNGAFSGLKSLSTLEMPTSVEQIGASAFEQCNLKEIKGWDNVVRIGSSAFKDAISDWEELVLPPKVSIINSRAFMSNTGLEYVELPATLSYIEKGAFDQCNNIKTIVCLAPYPPAVQQDAKINEVFPLGVAGDIDQYMPNGNGQATLYVPKGSLERYRNDVSWKCFYKIVELDSGVEELEQEAFDASLPVEMISLTGMPMGTFPDLQTAEASVAPGIYICRQGSNVQKIAVK